MSDQETKEASAQQAPKVKASSRSKNGSARKNARKPAKAKRTSLTNGAQMSWLLATTTKRAQAILEQTDQAARKIREDARAEADRYLEEVRRRADSADDGKQPLLRRRRKPRRESEQADGAALSSGSQMSWLLRTSAKRLENIFETADKAGEEIRANAQTEAQGYIEEARRQSRQYSEQARRQGEEAHEQAVRTATDRLERISTLNEELTALTEELLTQTAGVERQSEVVREALENATQTLSGELGAREKVAANGDSGAATAAGPLQPSNTTGPAAAAKQRGKRRRKFVAPQDGSPVSDGARVLALQAFVAGEEPQRIERRLREDFGIEDPGAVLQSVQGNAPATATD